VRVYSKALVEANSKN